MTSLLNFLCVDLLWEPLLYRVGTDNKDFYPRWKISVPVFGDGSEPVFGDGSKKGFLFNVTNLCLK